MSFLTLPNELFLIIAEYLGSKDLNHFLSTNRRLSVLLTPQLHILARKPIGTLPSLHWGILRNHIPLVTLLLSDSDASMVGTPCGNWWTALHYAAAEGRTQMVRLLLSHGAAVTPFNAVGETALEVAARFGSKDRFSLLAQLPAYRISAELCPIARWHTWVGNDEHETIVRLLLEHGADKNSADVFGRTALHWAAQVRNVGIVRVLLEAGADVNHAGANGDTALMWAVAGQRECVLEIVAMLVEHGADVGARNKVGYTALHYVARCGFVGAAALLLETDGVLLNAVNGWGHTALFYALVDPRGEDVSLMLLDKGADYGVADVEGDTVLHWAVRAGMVRACRALLERGARWDVTNLKGCTPFESIMGILVGDREEKEEELQRLFLERGAV